MLHRMNQMMICISPIYQDRFVGFQFFQKMANLRIRFQKDMLIMQHGFQLILHFLFLDKQINFF